MTSKERIDELREGIGRLTEHLDINWKWMRSNCNGKEKGLRPVYAHYQAMLKTIELLGGDWQRDENGKHKVFIAGVTAATDED